MATDLEIKLAAMMDVLRKQRSDILDSLVDAIGQRALVESRLAAAQARIAELEAEVAKLKEPAAT